MKADSVWASRFARAVAVVGIVVAVPAVQAAVCETEHPAGACAATPAAAGDADENAAKAAGLTGMRLDASSIARGSGYDDVLRNLEEAASTGGAITPAWFQAEIGLPPDARDVRVEGEGAVVGYVVDADSGDVLARLKARLQDAGWIAVSLGEAEGVTFVKESGACTWTLATCTQVGQATSVVFRCRV